MNGKRVRHLVLTCVMVLPGCSDQNTESAPVPAAVGSLSAEAAPARQGGELIPAEWTVAEDTSESGEVITASVQLPAARDIPGLMDPETPRLVLRCLDGRVTAAIDTEMSGLDTAQDPGTGGGLVAIVFDSAPGCE